MNDRQEIRKRMNLIKDCTVRNTAFCGSWCVHCLDYRSYKDDLNEHDKVEVVPCAREGDNKPKKVTTDE